MPSNYAHYRFGAAVLTTLPADIRRSIQRFRRLYDVGMHGPDLFYYHNPVTKNGTGTLGIRYHEITGKNFFTRVCRTIRMERSEAAKAYLYGVLCHYVLDSCLHPSVRELCESTGATHMEIEMEFDRFLLETDGKMPPNGQKLTKHLDLTEGECETVAKFYPPATGKTVRSALRSMVFFTKLLTAPEGIRRKMVEMGVGILGKETKGVILREKPNEKCTCANAVLLEQYDRAMALLPEYLQQLQANMTYSAPLEAEFEKPFG